MKLSRTKIRSFVGDVLPLWIEGEMTGNSVKWSADSDTVTVRDFVNGSAASFDYGVILTFNKEGNARVTATAGEETLVCEVEAYKRRTVDDDTPLNYYIGDMHDHMSQIHTENEFRSRTIEQPIDCLEQIKKEDKIHFSVITDHSCLLSEKNFYDGFTDAEKVKPINTVIFPGSESGLDVPNLDRFGLKRQNSGEIVCINADDYFDYRGDTAYDRLYDLIDRCPFVVLTLAHPQIVGYGAPTVWNFALDRNNDPRFKRGLCFVEMGNGEIRESNIINEYTYSFALDNGFFVSTTCSSDSHGPVWGYDAQPGKTVLMAQDYSKEAFLEALLSRRAYACESGNLKINYTVNSHRAPCTLPLSEKYNFHVDISYFKEDESTVPVKVDVISDYGNTVKTIEGIDFSSFDFEIESSTARYFFLRFVDSKNRRTWTFPVLTGRECDKKDLSSLNPLDKSSFAATDLLTGNDASVLVNGDPMTVYKTDKGKASIVIDMKESKSFKAFGHCAPYLERYELRKIGIYNTSEVMAEFASAYTLSVSNDGESFTDIVSGCFRVFGDEEIVTFPEVNARYIKLDISSNVGDASGSEDYRGRPLSVAEISVFE